MIRIPKRTSAAVAALSLTLAVPALASCSSGATDSPSSRPSAAPQTADASAARRIRITIGGRQMIAMLEANATADAIWQRLPMTVPMEDAYGRELVHRFAEPLPAGEPRTRGYEVGEIAYWPPRHSLVIFYEQNGEVIGGLQSIGRIEGDLAFEDGFGDVEVTWEPLNG